MHGFLLCDVHVYFVWTDLLLLLTWVGNVRATEISSLSLRQRVAYLPYIHLRDFRNRDERSVSRAIPAERPRLDSSFRYIARLQSLRKLGRTADDGARESWLCYGGAVPA